MPSQHAVDLASHEAAMEASSEWEHITIVGTLSEVEQAS